MVPLVRWSRLLICASSSEGLIHERVTSPRAHTSSATSSSKETRASVPAYCASWKEPSARLATPSASFIPASSRAWSSAISCSSVATSCRMCCAACCAGGPSGLLAYPSTSRGLSRLKVVSVPWREVAWWCSRSARSRASIAAASGLSPAPCAVTSGSSEAPSALTPALGRSLMYAPMPSDASGVPAKAAIATSSKETTPLRTGLSERLSRAKSSTCAESHSRCWVSRSAMLGTLSMAIALKGGRCLGHLTCAWCASRNSLTPRKSDLIMSEFLSTFLVILNLRVSANLGMSFARCGLYVSMRRMAMSWSFLRNSAGGSMRTMSAPRMKGESVGRILSESEPVMSS